MTGKLTIVQGDATQPKRLIEGSTIYLPHCCNDAGGWGKGFVVAITNRWGVLPREMYRLWAGGVKGAEIKDAIANRYPSESATVSLISQTRFALGGHQLIQLPDKIILVNMIGQHGYKGQPSLISTTPTEGVENLQYGNRPPIRYGATAKAMFGLAEFVESMHVVQNAVSSPLEQPTTTVTPWEIHCPRFGSDLAGGDWGVIEQMIFELWVDRGSNVTVYEWIPKT